MLPNDGFAGQAMTGVAQFELLLVLIGAVVVLELVARRLRLPPAAAFVLGGIGLALAPGVPAVELNPDLVLVLFLPPLLQASAWFTVWSDFKANLRIILQLAIGAVVFTTLAVGVVAHWAMPSLPWAACFALGAIVSPPDAVAAKAVLAGLRMPPRMVVLLEGESLVNDASGLVLYKLAVAAALTGTFSFWGGVGSFVGLAVGGVLVGMAFGWASIQLIRRLRDPNLVIVASLLVAWGSYMAAEAVHVSGVLSTVSCGLVLGRGQHALLSAVVRTQASAVWGVLVFLLESLVFILIGLALRGIVQRLGGGSMTALAGFWAPMAWVVVAVVLSRFAWLFPAMYVPRLLIPRLRAQRVYPPVAVPIVMGWAGMRGVVSLAVALALPEGFPGRDFILLTTFAVILVTVLVQGATLAPLIRALRLGTLVPPGGRTLLSVHQAQARVSAAQLAAVEALARDAEGAVRHPRLLEQYGYRAEASVRFSADVERLTADKDEHFKVVLAAVAAGRAELIRLHRAGEVHDVVLRRLEHALDLEEMFAAREVEGG